MKRNSGILDFNIEDLKSILPKRPSKWNYNQVKTFLKKFVKIGRVLDIFDEEEVDGKSFLSLNSKDEIFETMDLKRNDEKILIEWQKLLLDYERENFKKKSVEEINKRSNSPLEKNIPKKKKKIISEDEEEKKEKKIEEPKKKKKKKEEKNENSNENDFKDSSKKKPEKTIEKIESRVGKIVEKEKRYEDLENRKEKNYERKKKDDNSDTTVDVENRPTNKPEKTVDILEERAEKMGENCEKNQIKNDKPKKEKKETIEANIKSKHKEEESVKTRNLSNQNSSNFDDYNGKIQKNDKVSQKNLEKKYQPEKNVNSSSDDEERKSETIIRGSDMKNDFKITKSEPIRNAKNGDKKYSERKSNKLSKVEEVDSMEISLKKKSNENIEGLEDQYKTITQAIPTNLSTKFEISINVVNETARHDPHNFLNSFKICRSEPPSDNKKGIYLYDSQISQNHAQIILLKNFGYYLQDLGSTNHTFIKLSVSSRIKLREGFELLIGDSLFKILNLTKNQIEFEINKIRCKDKLNLKIKMTKDKLFFGKDPIPEDPINNDVYKFLEDSEIEKTHVIFHKEHEKIKLEPKLSRKGVWLKIGEKRKSSDFFLLKQFSEFKVGEVLLKVDKTFAKKARLCKLCQTKIRNTVFLPCNHAKLCETCASEEKRCIGRKESPNEKKKKIPCDSREYKKLIDLFELD